MQKATIGNDDKNSFIRREDEREREEKEEVKPEFSSRFEEMLT